MRLTAIIPTFNRAKLIARAIASVLAAIELGDEVIVVDDGSTDGTRDALKLYGDAIRRIDADHAGAGVARNLGIAAARTPLVAFLDSDDEWTPDHVRLHRQIYAQKPDAKFSFSDFRVQDARGQQIPRYLKRWHNDPRPWSQILGPGVDYSTIAPLPADRGDFPVHIGDLHLAEMLSDYVPTFTMVARRDALPDAKWFAEDVPVFEDWQCFGRLAGAGPCAFLDCETATQHGHRYGRLTDLEDLAKLSARILLLDRVWGQDAAFLQQHAREYSGRMLEQRLALLRCLLRMGRTAEARQEMRNMDAPLSYRLLSMLPGRVVAGAIHCRRTLRGRRTRRVTP